MDYIFIMGSFDEQKFFILMVSHLLIFYLWFVIFILKKNSTQLYGLLDSFYFFVKVLTFCFLL